MVITRNTLFGVKVNPHEEAYFERQQIYRLFYILSSDQIIFSPRTTNRKFSRFSILASSIQHYSS